jgi:signal transduction histidine kinase
LNRILDDLLTLENIENGFIISKFKYLNINDLVQGIIQNLKYLLNKNQTLLFENNCDEIIYHEPKIISIILTNLLSNAIKYSAENGRIITKINCDKSHLYFRVEDNGIGIPKNEKKLIFNRFFRAKNALYFPGTGIGLNIVKGYIKSLKGSISFESKEHKGTIFMVQLPKITNHEKDSFIN